MKCPHCGEEFKTPADKAIEHILSLIAPDVDEGTWTNGYVPTPEDRDEMDKARIAEEEERYQRTPLADKPISDMLGRPKNPS